MSQQHESDQRGIAHLLLIVIVVVVLAAIGFVGWKVYSNKNGGSTKNSASSGAPAPSANDKAVASAAETACLNKYHDKDLCKFVAAQEAAPFEKTPLKMTMTGTTSGQPGTFVLEQDGKGNNSLAMTGSGQTTNMITLNGQVYTQTAAGGPWITYGTGSSSTAQSSPASSLTDFLSSLSTTSFTKLGKEACGPLTCFKYQITDSTTPGATQYVWFDTGQHLMRQYYEAGVGGSSDSMTMTIAYQKVTINKPSPVQDLSTSTGQ